MAGAGDVNGDGLADVLVGARQADSRRRTNSGSAYVIFGRPAHGRVDLARLGRGGFRIDGAAPRDFAGYAVAGAGDVDGDGLADVVIGARGADGNRRADSGSAYVVFGRRTSSPIDLAALGGRGFRIDGAAAGDFAGAAVAGAGDVNGDGLADVAVGAYVVFGRASASPVDLAALGPRGFRIDGAAGAGEGFGDLAGFAVAGAGDVNGDGLGDILVGSPGAGPRGRTGAGAAHVVFGSPSTATVDLRALGGRGFRLDGASAGDWTGVSVAGAGDVDRDGLADVLVGTSHADPAGRIDAGAAYLVRGRTAAVAIDLASSGWGGFRIGGAAPADLAGLSVAAAGDVDVDGTPDVLVGAIAADNRGRANAGSAYVVYGRSPTADVDLADLGDGGFRADGTAANNHTGYSVAGVGDFNGDGWPDVFAGAEGADDNGRSGSGVVYGIYGCGQRRLH